MGRICLKKAKISRVDKRQRRYAKHVPGLRESQNFAIIVGFMKTHILRLSVAALGLLVPFSVASQGYLTTYDSIAGLGAEVTVEELDANASYTVEIFPPRERAFSLNLKTDATGAATLLVPGTKTETAGTYEAVLKLGEEEIAETAFEILPDSVDARGSRITVRHDAIVADGHDEAEVTVSLTDSYGNVLPGRPVELIGSGDEDIEPMASETDEWGEQTFVVTTREPGQIVLRAMDMLSATVLADRAEIEADDGIGGHTYGAQLIPSARAQSDAHDEIDRFQISVDPTRLEVNEVAKRVDIQAVDRLGRIVRDYTGTVHIFSPTDPDAVLPGIGDEAGVTTFTARDRGEKSFRLLISFSHAGKQILRVEDRTNPSAVISGQAEVPVGIDVPGGTSGGNGIVITSHENGDFVADRELTLVGVAEPSALLRVMINGLDVAEGEADQVGGFEIPLLLPESVTSIFTLRVQDAENGQDSGALSLTLDTEAPDISSITFAPEKPEEGSEVLLLVKSDPALKEVNVTIDGETLPLEENAKEPGTYQLLFTAPEANAYQPSIRATDKAGNDTELRATLSVSPHGLPVVTNVKASGRANAVELSWDPLKGVEVDAYRIYVGEEEGNFLYTLDTERASVAATVAGLRPGTRYYFAVTALQGERESEEKSEIISTMVLGTKLAITEEAGALLLEWTFPEETPLTSFLLEYGADKNALTERRVLNGALRAFTLRDLIDGVTYHFRLTPVATTGDILSDLAATGDGTPVAFGLGFHASAPDPIPFDTLDSLPASNAYHAGAPSTPGSGLPPVAVWAGLAGALLLILFEWHRRRTLRMTVAFMKAIEERYHS